jgi:hypothetical protein
LALTLLGVSTALAVVLSASPGTGVLALRRLASPAPRIQPGSTPLVGDASGDGVLDLVHETQVGGGVGFSARDARTGDWLWSSPPFSQTVGPRSAAVVGPRVLADHRGKLWGFDLATGRQIFQVTLPEQLDRYCFDGERAALVLREIGFLQLDLVTGELSSPERRPPPPSKSCFTDPLAELCVAPSTTFDAGAGPATRRQDTAGHSILQENGAAECVRLTRAATFGPPVARLSGFDGTKATWEQDVPAVEPRRAVPRVGPFALSRTRFIVSYGVWENVNRERATTNVTAFDIRTGQRLWDTTLPNFFDAAPIAISRQRVFLGSQADIVLDFEDGHVIRAR